MSDLPVTAKAVLFVLTSHQGSGDSGFYLPELTHPLAVLDRAGIASDFASIAGGLPPVYGVELDDPANARYWQDEAFQRRLHHTRPLAQVNARDYRAIMFVGGHGTMWDFPDNPDVQRLIREMYEGGQVVAAVCHGPSALVNVKLSNGDWLVHNKRVAAFTDAEERAVGLDKTVPFLLESTLKARGARHQAAADWQPQVVVDGNLITGQNPQSAAGVGEAIRDALAH